MTPIVNGLEAEFADRVRFVYLDAADGGQGQQVFEALQLPGHPSYALFTSNGDEVYRAFSILNRQTLQAEIAARLSDLVSSTAE